jgi:hypothetical protein
MKRNEKVKKKLNTINHLKYDMIIAEKRKKEKSSKVLR